MSTHYPIVFETEARGAISAYVPGLPVYAADDDQRTAARAIGDLLRAYLEAHPEATARATIRVAAVSQVDKRVVVRLASGRGRGGDRVTRVVGEQLGFALPFRLRRSMR